ncbi:MAG: UDP-N-acetylglucosamine--N-acetylmuramyl-(pentapeptide) pyrophosphoryl-undecaprenol N-acetylglucosamine transferase [Clostridia bacterium]|nr:UDP-N-acetylglucosamine--N-acetylmuramyl-(pentapeptide) pyrophosphoryl-undecaprenol N-acetylglucosamine transferase [Clostridia bacterium]
MRVLLTGGGTAGHINPALAIAEIIRRNAPGSVVEFVGVAGGKEEDLVPREGYKLHFVESAGIRRSLSPSNLRALYLALTSPYSKKTNAILDEFRPDLVVGTGGYASWPILVAAAKRKIPTAVHESNAIPGLAVKRLGRHVDEIWVNFSSTENALKTGIKSRVFCVGNPTRQAFGSIDKKDAREQLAIGDDRLFLLSFGGSLGAEKVNEAVLLLMRDYTAKHPEVLHIHATGKREFESCQKKFYEYGLAEHDNCILVDYLYDMPLRMAAADLVISRAGAMTLSELALQRKASILIPSPNVVDNHQFKNADLLASARAAALVEESGLASDLLLRKVTELLENKAMRQEMEQAVSAFADEEANKKIWERVVALTH